MRLLLSTLLLLVTTTANATIVQLNTDYGDLTINLYDVDTPKTVENFLRYVEAGHYDGVVIHRIETDFVLQSGGYSSVINESGNDYITSIPNYGTIKNEPVFSNVKGTIAMAKVNGYPNSATSQWFFNLNDNSQSLDPSNGGFTVFGQIIQSEANEITLNQLVSIPTFDFGGFTDFVPLHNGYTESEYNSNPIVSPSDEHFLKINSASIIDDTIDTASELEKPKNTLLDNSAGPISNMVLMTLLSLVLLRRRR